MSNFKSMNQATYSPMTTRYKTEGEKAGVKRRMAAMRKRKIDNGLKQYVFWLSEDGAQKVKRFIETLPENSKYAVTPPSQSGTEPKKS